MDEQNDGEEDVDREFSVGLFHELFSDPVLSEASDDEESQMYQTYDLQEAALYSYMPEGDQLEIRRRILYDEKSRVRLLILLESQLVLMPGQTYPLLVSNMPTLMSKLSNVATTCGTVGVLSTDCGYPVIGTTAEIYNFSTLSGRRLSIYAKGRQRFVIPGWKSGLRGERYVDNVEVEILPERALVSPLADARLTCLDRYRRNTNFRAKYRKTDMSCAPVPPWIIDEYDAQILVQKVLRQVKEMRMDLNEETIPQDPLYLSYWLLTHLPATRRVYFTGLQINSTVERLQLCLNTILTKKADAFNCVRCQAHLACRSNVVVMSAEGPTGTFCNPGGHVFDVITVSAANATVENVSPDPRFSWYPGYAWQIAYCDNCQSSIGWCFTAYKRYRLRQFFGITRASIDVKVETRLDLLDQSG